MDGNVHWASRHWRTKCFNRSPHQALYVGLVRRKVRGVLDADIRSFFDRMSHEWILKFVQHRVADNRILRLIQKWLKAGVREEGQWEKTERGTDQRRSGMVSLVQDKVGIGLRLWPRER